MDFDTFWITEYGDVRAARDYAGRKVLRERYGQYEHRYGWVIERIALHGANLDSNRQIVNVLTAWKRRGRMRYTDGAVTYSVRKDYAIDAEYDYSRKDFCVLRERSDSIWETEFGTAQTGVDFAGRIVRRDRFGSKDAGGWNIDHIRPLAKGGENGHANMQITSVAVNAAKADALRFSIDGVRYRVARCADTSFSAFRSTPYDYLKKDYCVIKETGRD